MKKLMYGVVAAGLLALSSVPAHAASYAYIVLNNTNPFTGDLSQATPGTGDDPNPMNGFFAGPSLPNGLNVGDDFHINRTLSNQSAGAAFEDNYIFNFASAPAGSAGTGKPTVHFAVGQNNAITDAEFRVWKDNDSSGTVNAGDTDEGGIVFNNVAVTNTGSFTIVGLTTGIDYILQVTGNLHPDVTNGAYQSSFKTVVPVPPAIALMITGVAALFGFGAMRRKREASSAAA